jgi:hypothetical protein
MLSIDLEALISAVGEALPGSAPFAAIPLFVDQIRWLDEEMGLDLLDRVVATAPPSTWLFTDGLLAVWPQAVAARALEAIRALPAGEERIEALLQVARHLTPAERDEALAGLLDGTYPEVTWAHTKPMSRCLLINAFVRTLPAPAREAWVLARARPDQDTSVGGELRARHDVDLLTEEAIRAMWARLQQEEPTRGVPLDYLGLASRLPPDLRAEALARIRACPKQSERLYHLVEFDEELTDEERREVVEVPWNDYTRGEPRAQGTHLQRVAAHLPRVSPAVRRRWLEVVLAFEDSYTRQLGLLALLPSLEGQDHEEAVSALLAAVEEDGCFHGDDRWDLLSEEALRRFLLRQREDPYGWHRDGLVVHIWAQRPASVADRLLPLLLEALETRPADTRLEIVGVLTPWLADRTAGAVPRALARLPVPVSGAAPDALYTIARVLRQP